MIHLTLLFGFWHFDIVLQTSSLLASFREDQAKDDLRWIRLIWRVFGWIFLLSLNIKHVMQIIPTRRLSVISTIPFVANENKAKNQVKIFRLLLALCSSSLAAASAFSSSTSAPTSGRKTIQSRRKTKLCEWRTDAGIKHFYLSLAITSQSPSQDYQLPLTKTWPFIKSAVKFGTTHSISRNTMDCRKQLWSRPMEEHAT